MEKQVAGRVNAQRLAIVREWAESHDCRLELEGEVGFGRECVGILWPGPGGGWGGHYVDTPSSTHNEYPPGYSGGLITPEYRVVLDKYAPPEDVAAYHKHDCLCVLGRDEDSVEGLVRWVEKIIALRGYVVIRHRESIPGSDTRMNQLLHGTHKAVLEFPKEQ